MTDATPLDEALWDDGIPIAEDFYGHVNSTWLSRNPIPAEYPMWGAYIELDHNNKELIHRILADAANASAEGRADQIQQLVGNYFAAGMDEQAIAAAGAEPLRPLLDRIDAIASADDVRALNLDLHRAGLGALFGLEVEADFEDSDQYLLYIGQAGLGLPERGYYLDEDDRSVALRTAYTAHIAAQFRNLSASESEATRTAESMLAFETRLAQASMSREELRDPIKTMNRREVAALDELMPGYRLGSYLRELGVEGETVSVDNPAFFKAVDAALTQTPLDVVKDVLRWRLVRGLASSLSPNFEDEAFAFYHRMLRGQQEQQPRWRRIIESASLDVGEAVAQLFVRETFPPEAKARMEALVDHLLAAMGRAIRTNSWMTEATRSEALKKLDGFGYKIGYPDKWRDYSGLELGRTSYAGNRMAAKAFEMRRQLGHLGQPMDRAEWDVPAHVVNAYYHPIRNEIVFPAGILQPPFFHRTSDDAVNYGAIGTVIGHEITHGFDDAGSRFDAAGALRNWWSDEDRAEFERRAAVVEEQFNGYEIVDGVHVNGKLTLGENIADLGGVAIALDAMHEAVPLDAPLIDGLTPDQRFFLAYATQWRLNTTDAYARLLANIDTHSPTRYRINGPLSNTPEFAAAFDVPNGAPMALPEDQRAKVW